MKIDPKRMKIDPNAPAFSAPGLTIRAEIASRCLAGMMADGKRTSRDGDWTDYINDAILFADTLITTLNESE